jgi:hypothetical protein
MSSAAAVASAALRAAAERRALRHGSISSAGDSDSGAPPAGRGAPSLLSLAYGDTLSLLDEPQQLHAAGAALALPQQPLLPPPPPALQKAGAAQRGDGGGGSGGGIGASRDAVLLFHPASRK